MKRLKKKLHVRYVCIVIFFALFNLWGCSREETLPFLFIENPYYQGNETKPIVRFSTKSAVRCNIQMQKNNNEKSVFHIDVHNSPKILQKIFAKNLSKRDFLIAQEKNFLISKNFYTTKKKSKKQNNVRISLFVNLSSLTKTTNTKTILQKIQSYGKQFDYVFIFWEEEEKEDISLSNKSKILSHPKSETAKKTDSQLEDKKKFTLFIKNLVIKKAVFVFYKKQNKLHNFLMADSTKSTANGELMKETSYDKKQESIFLSNAQKTSDDYEKKYRNYVVDSPFYAELSTTENPLLVPIIYFSRTFSFRG